MYAPFFTTQIMRTYYFLFILPRKLCRKKPLQLVDICRLIPLRRNMFRIATSYLMKHGIGVINPHRQWVFAQSTQLHHFSLIIMLRLLWSMKMGGGWAGAINGGWINPIPTNYYGRGEPRTNCHGRGQAPHTTPPPSHRRV